MYLSCHLLPDRSEGTKACRKAVIYLASRHNRGLLQEPLLPPQAEQPALRRLREQQVPVWRERVGEPRTLPATDATSRKFEHQLQKQVRQLGRRWSSEVQTA